METRIDRPQLSISLLASNRPDTIRKCLDSLRPILEAIPSELILVDTSKNPVIRQILLEYSDQVYEFEWCKDFSKARNVGLKKSKGEWFLFLDDDEWFVETDELIQFFQSGEYKEYGYANYQVRNFYDPSYTYYSDSWVSRMIRLDSDTEFRSKIHEYMYPVRGKCKHIYSMVYHSGYIYATEEQKRAHFERNSSLLLDMIKEEPDNLRWQIQLVQEYRSIKEWETLKGYCRERLEATRNINEKYDNVHLGTFYAGYSEALVFLQEYDEALKICIDALADKRSTDLCKALMHLRLAEIYLKKEDYEKSIAFAELYLKEAESLGKDEKALVFQKMALLVNEAFDDTNIKKAYSVLIACDLRQKSTKVFCECYEKLGWKTSVIYVYDGTEKYIVEAMATMECEDVFVEMVTDAYKNNEFRRLMCKAADAWEERDEAAFYKVMSVYAKAETDDWYIWYARCRIAYKNGDVDAFCDAVENMYRTIPNVFDVPAWLCETFEKEGVAIADWWRSVSVDLWKVSVDRLFEQADTDKIEFAAEQVKKNQDVSEWRRGYFDMAMARVQDDMDAVLLFYKKYYAQEYVSEHPEHLPVMVQKRLNVELPQWMVDVDELSDKGILALEQARATYENLENMQGIYFRKCYADAWIRLESEKENYDTLLNRFHTFMNAMLEYYLTICTDAAFEGEMEILPPEARAAVYLNMMFSCEETDLESRIACLRQCASAYPALGNNVKKLAQLMGDRKKEVANNELLQMVSLMKEKIRAMVEQGMKEEALAVLAQVRALAPKDRGLLRMEEELKGIKRDIVLSISILASNRKETIEKTIQSLEALRSKVSCELIIVDTGCSPELHNYLASHADIITNFQWCNDFAKARNAGLSLATGEWFMYMDDDEWFADADELITFFTSGEYKKYDSASYIVRNYLDMQGSQYTDSWLSRMVCLEPGMQFRSRIHEYLTPKGDRKALVHAIADHYGYVYETEEALRKHFERNETLLKEMIKEEPDSLRWYMLLAQEYRTVQEWDMLYELGETGLSLIGNNQGLGTNIALGTFYGAQIVAAKEKGEHAEVLTLCKKAIEDVRNTELFRAFCELQMSWSAYWLGYYEEAKTHGEQYLVWKNYFADKEQLLVDQRTAPFVSDAFDVVMQKQVYSILICADLRRGKKENLDKYLENLEWNTKNVYLFEDMIPTLAQVIHEEGEESYEKVLQMMQKNKALWEYYKNFSC